jgi:hypothetical protein
VAAYAARGGREAGGTRQGGSWSGRDVALAVGIGTQSERRPGTRAEERGQVGQASLSWRGLGPVSKWSWAALSSGQGSVRCTMFF